MAKLPIIAIDGPAGAGKSTVARRLAETLSFVLVDTGAMYRVVALAAKEAGYAPSDAAQVTALSQALVAREALRFERDAALGVRVFLDGRDVSTDIRTPDIAMGASTVSAHPGVRDALLAMQRQAGKNGGVVLEGRDIGTVVFPDADIKFFLTADAAVRAKRRHAELLAREGNAPSFEETLADVKRRDDQDMNRPVAPLRQADDAIRIDSSALSFDETVRSMIKFVEKR